MAGRRARRQKLIVGGLAFALIAPLTAGLIGVTLGNSGGSGSNPPPATLPSTIPPEPISLPWVPAEFAGATITGPTPCPTNDGSTERTTAFEQAPPVCIGEGATYELAFETPAGAFSLPINSAFDLDAANLAVVLALYQSYESTPVTAVRNAGLLTVGSLGDAGFTIPAAPPTGPLEELYPVGSVVALADIDQTVSGSLSVVVDEVGQSFLQRSARHVIVGMIDDMTEIQAIFDSPGTDQSILIDSVTVTETG